MLLPETDLVVDQLIGPEGHSYYGDICSASFESYEPDLCFLIKNYLNENSIYFEIGANVGATVIPIAKYLKHGFIYAVESSQVYDYLKNNVEIYSLTNTKLFNVVLGREDTEEKDTKAKGKKRDRLTPPHPLGEDDSLTEGDVKIEKLDTLVNRQDIKYIDFIKIDVKGFKKDILEGCTEVIKKYNPIFYIEFNSWCLISLQDENFRNFLNFLFKTFTHIYSIENSVLCRLETESKLTDILYQNLMEVKCFDNLICVNGDIESRKRSKLWFDANELKTQIGEKGSYIFCKKGKRGLINFGPYVSLSKGKYKFNICFLTSANSGDCIGNWDIYVGKVDKIIGSGEIISDGNFCLNLEGSFEIIDEINNLEVEIRTFSYGHADIVLQLINIEKIL